LTAQEANRKKKKIAIKIFLMASQETMVEIFEKMPFQIVYNIL